MFSLLFRALDHKMKHMKHPYTQFDLPTRHITGNDHYIPPRARDSAEADRRHELPTGTVLLEQQHRGLLVARTVLEAVHDANDVAYTAKFLAVCGLNSAWYQFARGSQFMRRHVALPYLARPADQERPSSDDILASSRIKLARVAETAGTLAAMHAKRQSGERDKADTLGRSMAHAALEAACAPIADTISSRGAFAVQATVRTHALGVLDTARNLSLELGTPPSFAQLADPDSDLSVHIRREAPTDVYYAFEEALDAHAMPR